MKAAPLRFHLTLAALLAIAGTLTAAAPAEVSQLKAQYQTAVSKAVQELTEIYKSQLQELQKKYRAANDSGGIAATTNELARLGVASPGLPTSTVPVGSTGATPTVVSQVGDEKFFVNKSWYSAANAEYHFEKDGSGTRTYTNIKAPFTWRKLDTGIIEVAGRNEPGGPQIMWFFKFDNKRTALFGNTSNAMTAPLRADK